MVLGDVVLNLEVIMEEFDGVKRLWKGIHGK